MDPQYRSLFNASFSRELYQRYVERLATRLGVEFEFRLAETPLFLPSKLSKKLTSAAEEIVEQLSEPDNINLMKKAIPARWDTPGMDSLPSFAQVDFAIVRSEAGELEPRLIELQGFPSLTAMQVVQCDAWAETLQTIDGLGGDWSCWFNGLDRSGFLDIARKTIVGDCDPREVILMDIDPPSQKTWPDFVATKMLLDVDAISPTDLFVRERKLYRRLLDGQVARVRRIHNRVVFDELERKKIELPFDYRDDLDVEWTPHPNWYWVWSKQSLPFLNHPAVPRAMLLSDLTEVPDRFGERYVLKPLYSFAGGGVNVEPTAADLAAIPHEERANWCVQEKIEYAPALQAPDGGVKVEIRMMFFRPEHAAKPILAQNLVRLSRGKMHGVDFNKDYTWVGATVGIFRPGD